MWQVELAVELRRGVQSQRPGLGVCSHVGPADWTLGWVLGGSGPGSGIHKTVVSTGKTGV